MLRLEEKGEQSDGQVRHHERRIHMVQGETCKVKRETKTKAGS